MGLIRWLRDKLEGDDGYEPGPDEVVTVGHVNAAVSGLVLAELAAAGIRAELVVLHVGYHGMAQTGVMCFAKDRAEAARIIDTVLDPVS